jgi:acyl-CoA thioester hydrolase
MGIVYHTNYVRWFEIGRSELFRDMGIQYREVEASGFNLPLTKVYCHYLLPARYDDILLVETDIDYLKRASIRFRYRIWDDQRKNLLAEGYSVHACTGGDGRILRIPESIAGKIRSFYPQTEETRQNPWQQS